MKKPPQSLFVVKLSSGFYPFKYIFFPYNFTHTKHINAFQILKRTGHLSKIKSSTFHFLIQFPAFLFVELGALVALEALVENSTCCGWFTPHCCSACGKTAQRVLGVLTGLTPPASAALPRPWDRDGTMGPNLQAAGGAERPACGWSGEGAGREFFLSDHWTFSECLTAPH